MTNPISPPKLDYAAIGERIDHVRKLLNLSKVNMARKLGYSPPFFLNLIKGVKKVNTDCLHRMHHAYNVNTIYLLSGDGNVFQNDGDAVIDEQVRKKLGAKLLDDVLMLMNEMMRNPEFARRVVNRYIRHDTAPPRIIKKPKDQ